MILNLRFYKAIYTTSSVVWGSEDEVTKFRLPLGVNSKSVTDRPTDQESDCCWYDAWHYSFFWWLLGRGVQRSLKPLVFLITITTLIFGFCSLTNLHHGDIFDNLQHKLWVLWAEMIEGQQTWQNNKLKAKKKVNYIAVYHLNLLRITFVCGEVAVSL